MTTLAFLGHVQRNEAVVITLAQDVHADGWILLLKFGDVFDGHWEGEAGKVHSVLICSVKFDVDYVGQDICSRGETRQSTSSQRCS